MAKDVAERYVMKILNGNSNNGTNVGFKCKGGIKCNILPSHYGPI